MSTLSLTKEAKIHNGEKTISLTSVAGKIGQPLVYSGEERHYLAEVSCPQIKVCKRCLHSLFSFNLIKLNGDQKRALVWLACWEIRAQLLLVFPLLQRTTLNTKSLIQCI